MSLVEGDADDGQRGRRERLGYRVWLRGTSKLNDSDNRPDNANDETGGSDGSSHVSTPLMLYLRGSGMDSEHHGCPTEPPSTNHQRVRDAPHARLADISGRQHPVDAGPADLEALGDGGGTKALLTKLLDLGEIDRGRAPLVDTPQLCSLNSTTLARF